MGHVFLHSAQKNWEADSGAKQRRPPSFHTWGFAIRIVPMNQAVDRNRRWT